MKRSRQLALLVMAQAPWLLTACDNTPEPVNRQGFYTSVDACMQDGNTRETCERASHSADIASTAPDAPRYKTRPNASRSSAISAPNARTKAAASGCR
jgi:uncharacterized protein YgiB involved in biofilm formation